MEETGGQRIFGIKTIKILLQKFTNWNVFRGGRFSFSISELTDETYGVESKQWKIILHRLQER